MRKVFVTLIFCFLFVSSYAQDFIVKGVVKDNQGLPVPGLAVIEKGTANGVVTDDNGQYQISTRQDAVLEFSSIGYKMVSEPVNGRATINITVEEDALQLDAVVAIGYGSVRKKDLTTAVSTVNTDDISTRPIHEVSGFIQGKVAGVTVQTPNGQPGTGISVRIRGSSSLESTNDPLYVVDGLAVGTGSYAISYLSPQDIESMQILKDASSAAIYGSRAANGVVLITTKQGKKGRGPQISFTSYAGITKVTKTYESLNLEQYKELLVDEGFQSIAESIPEDAYDRTDWFNNTYRTGVNQNYTLSVSGASDKVKYYISAGYSDEKGIINTTYNKRFSAKANIEADIFKWITVGANASFSTYKNGGYITSSTGANRGGAVLAVISTPTYAPIMDPDEPERYYNNFYGVSGLNSPAEDIARTKDNYTDTDRYLISGFIRLNFTKDLHLKSTVSTDRRFVHSYSYLDPVAINYGRTVHGSVSDARSGDNKFTWDNVLSYDKVWSAKHNFEAMAGSSYIYSKWEQLSGSRTYIAVDTTNTIYGLNAGNNGGLRGQSQGFAEWAILSFFGRVSYNFDSRYYVTANFRADRSSKLAPGHKWGYFPSASAAWRLSGEPWMEDIDWISDLKIRAGWGVQGNQEGLNDYAWFQTYSTNYYDWTTSQYAQAVPTVGAISQMKNEDLTWESTNQANVGIDFSILQDRVQFTLDGYYKYTKDMLMTVPLPSTAPASSIVRNEGEMSNWGIEFAVSSVNIKHPNFVWTTDFNVAMNRNKLEKLSLQKVYYYATTSETQNESIIRMAEGVPLSSFWGYKALGVDPETGLMIYEDVNGDGNINASDKQYLGCASPKCTFGMTNAFSFYGVSISFLLLSNVGNSIYNASKIDMTSMSNGYNQTTDVLRRWRVPGMQTDIPKANESYNTKASSRYIEDGSFLKLKNITVAYDVSGKWLRKIKISKLQPYVTLENMFTWTNYTGYDPEMSYSTDSRTSGIEWGTYPCVKSVVFGLNIQFN